MVPLRKTIPYEQPPRPELEGEAYTLDKTLVDWAFSLTKSVHLDDSEKLRTSRARFEGFPNALRPPFVTKGDDLSASTFWHGTMMDAWANEWVKYYTRGTGNYMVCGMEDSGTLQALTFLGKAGRVDPQRVLVLRTVSNYDRQAPGSTAGDSLKTRLIRQFSGKVAWIMGECRIESCIRRF
jgi:purine nucleoside permease